ncbi:MAG: alpha/beta hydrolase [Betaproteobacteria bacterium]|nr:alpha/beta hydrolase [Betaproteobacteria bacterium]
MKDAFQVAIPKKSGAASLVGFVLLLVLLQAQLALDSSGVLIERVRLADAYDTPALHFSPAPGLRSGAVAVLVHGHQCNKAMLAQLARYLAARGVEAYAIDLPGHGESQRTFAPEHASTAAASAVAAILERSRASPASLVLIGHSFGAVALGPEALRRDVLATVFLGPGMTGGLSRRLPNNALIVTAEHDYDFIKRDAQAMYEALTAGENTARGNLVGDFRQQDARLWEEIPGVEHISLLFDARVFRQVAEWIDRAAGNAVVLQSSDATGAARRTALAAIALSLVIAALFARFATGAAGAAEPVRNWVRPAIAIVAALYFAVIVTQAWVPLRFLRLQEGEILASLMAVCGILGLAFLAPLEDKITCRLRSRDALVAVALFFATYALALITIDRDFYTLRIAIDDWQRLATLGVTATAAAPFFLLQEELLRRLQGISSRPLRQFALVGGGVLVLVIAFGASLYFVGSRLDRFNAALAGLLVYCALASAILRAASKDTAAGVLYASLVTGWIVAAGFFHY